MNGSDWRTVAGYPDYSVSRFGEIMSHRAGRILKPAVVKGYHRVGLRVGGVRRIVSVHTVVAETFLGARPEGKQCAHLDGNAANNAVSNLAWVTKQENEAHKRLHGTATIGQRSPHAKLTDERAQIIREATRRPLTRREIALLAGVSEHVVEGVLDRGTYSTGSAAPQGDRP